MFRRIDLEVEEEVKMINLGETMLNLEAKDLRPNIVKKRKEATSRFWTNLRIKENMLAQKSRLK